MEKESSLVYVADGAKVIGDVKIGSGSSVWYNAVIRGDSNIVKIGNNTNVQDNAVLHVGHEHPLMIGDSVTIGHGAIVHGCMIGNNVLIGMGAIVLNGAHIKKNSLVGAGALVTENKEFPEGSLIIGSPAKAVRELTEEDIRGITENANEYVRLSFEEE